MRFAWIDLETAGLDPRFHPILEIALVVTDTDLNELIYFSTVVRPKNLEQVIERMRPVVKDMHSETGLLKEIEDGKGMSTKLAEATLALMLDEARQGDEDLYLSGSSVHFDRKFLERQMPEITKLLHYRNIDVSTIRTLTRIWHNEEFQKRDAHRALDDIRESIEELRTYRRRYFNPLDHLT